MGGELLVGISALILNVIVALVGLTWGLAKIRDTVKDEIIKYRIELNDDIDSTGRSFGESIAAVREKIREVELFIRDTYVRRDNWSEGFERIEASLRRMEQKIDEAKAVAANAAAVAAAAAVKAATNRQD